MRAVVNGMFAAIAAISAFTAGEGVGAEASAILQGLPADAQARRCQILFQRLQATRIPSTAAAGNDEPCLIARAAIPLPSAVASFGALDARGEVVFLRSARFKKRRAVNFR
jgi:hypothetical protein